MGSSSMPDQGPDPPMTQDQMRGRRRDAGHRAELVEVIRQIRNRWRLKLALRGVVVVVAGSLLALLLSASGLEALRFSATAIIAFRVIVGVVFAALAGVLAVAAAETAGQRRAGRAVSRGTRSVARGLDSERGRGEQATRPVPRRIRTRSSTVSSSRRSRSAARSSTTGRSSGRRPAPRCRRSAASPLAPRCSSCSGRRSCDTGSPRCWSSTGAPKPRRRTGSR